MNALCISLDAILHICAILSASWGGSVDPAADRVCSSEAYAKAFLPKLGDFCIVAASVVAFYLLLSRKSRSRPKVRSTR